MTVVSVVIPVYNESESIERVSKALKAQEFKDMVLNRRSESNPTLETIKVTFSYVFRRLTHRTPHWFVDLYLKLGDKFNLILR